MTCLRIAHLAPFAQGGQRLCFVHPDDPGRCVKITKPRKNGVTLRAGRGWRGFFRTAAQAAALKEGR